MLNAHLWRLFTSTQHKKKQTFQVSKLKEFSPTKKLYGFPAYVRESYPTPKKPLQGSGFLHFLFYLSTNFRLALP